MSPPIRPMGQWAEEEIVLPRGKYRGQRYRLRRKPASRLWFEALDSRQWLRHIYTGPTQSGKTLDGFIIPLLYLLFERREDVICGVPDMKLATRKWHRDIKPVLAKTRYNKFMPRRGAGSKGGDVTDVRFTNGASLLFMSAGGGDKSRASETAQNLIITEADGFDAASETSRESDPIGQLEARTLSFDNDAFIISECTVSIETGHTWSNLKSGTDSTIVRPCPHCNAWVTPEREHFGGWERAENEIEAGKLARFHCPECAKPWTDEERFTANESNKLIHRGQSIDADGNITGDPPQTRTFGFRMSAIDNPFRSSEMLGSIEWKIPRSRDQEAAEKEARQFQWTLPDIPPEWEDVALDPMVLAHRIGKPETPAGIIPDGFDVVTVGVDIRATQLHYVVVAWASDSSARIIQYGELKVHSRRMGLEPAIIRCLQYLRDEILSKTLRETGAADPRLPDAVWIDANWQSPTIYSFCQESNAIPEWRNIVRPVAGRGQSVKKGGGYTQPAKKTTEKPYVGERFYFSKQKAERLDLVMIDADYWKSMLHSSLGQSLDESGAMSIFLPAGGDHGKFARQLCAEKEVKEFIPDKGVITKWVTKSRVNHYLDAAYYNGPASRFCGVEAGDPIPTVPAQTQDEPDAVGMQMPDGRNFYSTQRPR